MYDIWNKIQGDMRIMNNYAKHMGFNPPTSVQIITLVPRELLYTQNSFLLYILLNAQKPKT